MSACRWTALLLCLATACQNDDAVRAVPEGGTTPDGEAPHTDGSTRGNGFSLTGRPTKRSDVAAAYDPASGAMLVFGGDNGPIVNQNPSAAYLGDSWLLSIDEGWTPISATPAPSPRGRYAVAHDTASRRSYFFGGRWREAGTRGNYLLHNDLWAFDFEARSWSLVHDGQGVAPAPRYFSATGFDAEQGAVVLWGGDVNPSALGIQIADEVWAYQDGGWSQRTVTGSSPSARLWVAYAHDTERNRLVVFGGQVGDFVTPSMNDLYALDLNQNRWSLLHDGTGLAPSGRFSASMVYDSVGDRYLVFGGHADAGVTNDVWAFDPRAGEWRLLYGGDTFTGATLGCLGNPREIPQAYVNEDLDAPERRATPALALFGEELWLFGGESDCSDHLDDLWHLNLRTGQWSEVAEARSGESCARRDDACECLCL